ncbi:MAG: DUF4263 domain-containing protein [Anaerolineaceae bacterium]|nr:DUF4263 domain-containing protein [Anaerolineaceae bacterium]
MDLYERNYSELTPDEEANWSLLQEDSVVKTAKNIMIYKPFFRKLPKAVRHYQSIFPNNYLDPVDLENVDLLSDQINQFVDVLDSTAASEREILNYIKDKRTYPIIASILNEYFHFGHHEAYIFPEFQLGNSYQVDYLLVGNASGGWNFVYVELEAPIGRITVKSGDFGNVFQKGFRQVRDWDSWLEQNYSSLRETFCKSKKNDVSLPDEFIRLDKSRISYVVVAGRRNDFSSKTYREQRLLENDSIYMLHYDNLIDSATNIIGQATY